MPHLLTRLDLLLSCRSPTRYTMANPGAMYNSLPFRFLVCMQIPCVYTSQGSESAPDETPADRASSYGMACSSQPELPKGNSRTHNLSRFSCGTGGLGAEHIGMCPHHSTDCTGLQAITLSNRDTVNSQHVASAHRLARCNPRFIGKLMKFWLQVDSPSACQPG